MGVRGSWHMLCVLWLHGDLQRQREGLWVVRQYVCQFFIMRYLFAHYHRRSAVSGISGWFGISVTYIRFHRGLRAQGIDRKSLPYFSSLQPFAAYYAAVGCLLVVVVSSLPAGDH